MLAPWLWMECGQLPPATAAMTSLPWWTGPWNCAPKQALSSLSCFCQEHFITVTGKETKTVSQDPYQTSVAGTLKHRRAEHCAYHPPSAELFPTPPPAECECLALELTGMRLG